ncbi:MAG TPA: hypothetical protein VMG41_17120 [Gemmatimonadales bacterium]|nr:hypothetical protein [Gemmatimonadales bacterium]
MAANQAQGRYLTLFLAALTVLCAGIAYFSSGIGKLVGLVGVVGLVAALAGFSSIKGGEGKTPQRGGASGLKATGAILAAAGWILVLVGIQIVTTTGGRIVLGLLGIGVSLYGITSVLPAAYNKNASWKG